MKTLALDLSTKATGVAVFDDDKLIHYERISSTAPDIYDRMIEMCVNVEQIIRDYNIDRAAIEDVPIGEKSVNFDVAHKLCVLQGMILHVFKCNNINFTIMMPSRWRSLIGLNCSEYTCSECGSKFLIYSENYRGTCPVCNRQKSNQYKRHALNTRDLLKERAVNKVNDLYEYNFVYYKTESKNKISNDNEAEAICLGLAYIKWMGDCGNV